MSNVLPQSPAACSLQAGEVLTVTADAVSTGRVGRLSDVAGARVPDMPISYTALAASSTLTFGPFPQRTRHLIEALTGSVSWSQSPGNPAHVEIVGNASDLREIIGAGAPVDYSDGDPVATGQNVAGRGSRFTDVTNGTLYMNVGTKVEPTWIQFAPVAP